MARKRARAAPRLVRATVQANIGGWRRGQVVEVWPDDPLLGHYLLAVDSPEPAPEAEARVLLGVAPPEDDGDAQPG